VRRRKEIWAILISDFVSSHISFWNDATSYLDQILDANPDNIDEILDDPNLRDSRKETATVSGRRKCVKRGQWVETGPTEMRTTPPRIGALFAKASAISPFVNKLMLLIRKCGCVPEGESDDEIALREAIAKSIIHGNHENPPKTLLCSFPL
jgi:hypothetical protein